MVEWKNWYVLSMELTECSEEDIEYFLGAMPTAYTEEQLDEMRESLLARRGRGKITLKQWFEGVLFGPPRK